MQFSRASLPVDDIDALVGSETDVARNGNWVIFGSHAEELKRALQHWEASAV